MKPRSPHSIQQPEGGETAPQRYSRRPLPPYRHRPGRTPHPVLHPAGHSYGRQGSPAAPFDPHCWQESEDFLYGIDLFNRNYFWEAHEAWESLWKSVPAGSAESLLLRGLILAAAALLKRETGRFQGMRSLRQKSLARLQDAAGQHPLFCGIDLVEWTRELAQLTTEESSRDIRIQLSVTWRSLRLGAKP